MLQQISSQSEISQFAYGFRRTGQKEKNILVPRECFESETIVMFNDQLLSKAQYVALEELCLQYNSSPEMMFAKPDTLEIENGLVTAIKTTWAITHTSDKKLSIPKNIKYLRKLECVFNELEQIAGLPAQLQDFDCSHNQLCELPDLPYQLYSLDCACNDLSVLPELPAKLEYLSCLKNKLCNLPVLPAKLQNLFCHTNKLCGLPELPARLQNLICGENKLAALPELPAQLQILNCKNNELSALPKLPPQLNTFYCDTNQLLSLPDLPARLQNLYCANNYALHLSISDDQIKQLAIFEYYKISNEEAITQQYARVRGGK